MKSNQRSGSWLSILLLALSGWLTPAAQAAGASAAHNEGRNRLAHLQKFANKLDSHFVGHLSTGGATMFHVAKILANPAVLGDASIAQARHAIAQAATKSAISTSTQAAAAAGEARAARGPVPVNDASLDYQLTRFGGFTQSETSSAWCGDAIVAGFNDSGALVRSVIERVGGSSISGVAVSRDRGRSFTGLHFLNPGPDPGTFLGGDPVVICSDPRHFAYASLLSQVSTDAQGNIVQALTGIAVNRSSDGGLEWDDPIVAVSKDASEHFLDKEWMAVDPRNPQHLYVTYTDFGAFGSDPTCNDHITPGIGDGGPDARIEMVTSRDGGSTWSAPVLLDRMCNLEIGQNISGSQVAVGPHGQVYVAYSVLDQKNVEIRLRRSADGGVTFGSTVVVAEATAASVLGFDHLQGNFRTNAFPSLVVDTFGGSRNGTLYLVWTDASVHQVADAVGNIFIGDPKYAFGDVVLSVSHDGGASWSAPRPVSPTPAGFQGAGRDQFMAGVATDVSGHLAICYSDRRLDSHNFTIDHFCSVSRDHGATFEEVRQTSTSWTPTHITDVFINPSYMGDYDTVSSDATGAHPGIFSTFQIQTNTNPDVFGTRLEF